MIIYLLFNKTLSMDMYHLEQYAIRGSVSELCLLGIILLDQAPCHTLHVIVLYTPVARGGGGVGGGGKNPPLKKKKKK